MSRERADLRQKSRKEKDKAGTRRILLPNALFSLYFPGKYGNIKNWIVSDAVPALPIDTNENAGNGESIWKKMQRRKK
jgi:hypothetical protein